MLSENFLFDHDKQNPSFFENICYFRRANKETHKVILYKDLCAFDHCCHLEARSLTEKGKMTQNLLALKKVLELPEDARPKLIYPQSVGKNCLLKPFFVLQSDFSVFKVFFSITEFARWFVKEVQKKY